MNFSSWAFSRDFWNSPTNLLWSGNKLFYFISKIKKTTTTTDKKSMFVIRFCQVNFVLRFLNLFFKRNFEKKSCFLSEQTFHDNLFKILFYTNFIFCSSSLLLLLFLLFFWVSLNVEHLQILKFISFSLLLLLFSYGLM